VPNECPVVDCSRRPGQPHKMPSCRVVALCWYDQITMSGGTESSKQGWETVKTGMHSSLRSHVPKLWKSCGEKKWWKLFLVLKGLMVGIVLLRYDGLLEADTASGQASGNGIASSRSGAGKPAGKRATEFVGAAQDSLQTGCRE